MRIRERPGRYVFFDFDVVDQPERSSGGRAIAHVRKPMRCVARRVVQLRVYGDQGADREGGLL